MRADGAPCERHRGASQRVQGVHHPLAPPPHTSILAVSLVRSPPNSLQLHVVRGPTAALAAATAPRRRCAGGGGGGGGGGVAATVRQGGAVHPGRRARRRNVEAQRGGTTRSRTGHSKTPLFVGDHGGRQRHGTDAGGRHPATCACRTGVRGAPFSPQSGAEPRRRSKPPPPPAKRRADKRTACMWLSPCATPAGAGATHAGHPHGQDGTAWMTPTSNDAVRRPGTGLSAEGGSPPSAKTLPWCAPSRGA